MPEAMTFFAPQAWIDGRWAHDVLLTAEHGRWSAIRPDAGPAARAGAVVLAGPVLPGLVNAHSHAFQRAIVGLTERGQAGGDNFWRWRDRMYSAANRITPDQLEAIAGFLYAELLQAGYTQVCEFHYLHNDRGGRPYADPLELSLALVRAARRVGMGLTLLPTLYMRSGFGAKGLRDDQQRFASAPESVLRIADAIAKIGQQDAASHVRSGVAVHSLRAVDESALRELASAARERGLPVHIHIAEQQQEVDDCVAAHGRRPIEWLLGRVPVDARWNLVHATQTVLAELEALRTSAASIVICPSTEANLGDGVFDLPGWTAGGERGEGGGRWSIGSDSHVTRSWIEELRLLEYSQRLVLRQRNVAAQCAGQESSAAALFNGALAGGSQAAGLPLAGIAPGQRADFMVVDTDAPALAGIPADHLLDALVFSSPQPRMQSVFVGGVAVSGQADRAGYVAAMQALWG